MNRPEALLLLAEIDLAWPSLNTVPIDNEPAVLVWAEWLKPYDLDTARQAVRAFGAQQARPPSLAQVLGECREICGDVLPSADEVLAEFRKVVREHSTRSSVDPAWFTAPEIGAFAMSGAFRDWGESTDPAFNPERASAASAQAAALRRRWDSFAARVERTGLRAACARLLLEPEQIALVCEGPVHELGSGGGA